MGFGTSSAIRGRITSMAGVTSGLIMIAIEGVRLMRGIFASRVVLAVDLWSLVVLSIPLVALWVCLVCTGYGAQRICAKHC